MVIYLTAPEYKIIFSIFMLVLLDPKQTSNFLDFPKILRVDEKTFTA